MTLEAPASGREGLKLTCKDPSDNCVFDAVVVMANEISHAADGMPVGLRFQRLDLAAQFRRRFGNDEKLSLNGVAVKVLVS